MDKLYIGTNTKMYKTQAEALEHVTKLAELTADISREELKLFVIPSYTSIAACAAAVDGRGIDIGAQSIGWGERAALTGEISPLMLEEAGAKLVMVGHSERRHVLHETDADEEKRVLCAAEHGFTTLLCVGETAEEKSCGISAETLSRQLKIGLHSLEAPLAKRLLWIAYEPVWAIGEGGVPADEGYADEMHAVIKSVLKELYGDAADSIPVLYGGSVNAENAPKLIVKPNIDGLFIGRSAWDAQNFSSIIHNVYKLWKSA